jgi:hypothetical protein
MPEARRSERVKTLLGAKIIFNNRMSVVDCVVRNISSSGAKLALTDSLPIPGEFELRIPQKGCSYRARLVWRNSEGVGVEFRPPADAESSPEARLRELETENARLQERIRVLSKRLADLGHDPNCAA